MDHVHPFVVHRFLETKTGVFHPGFVHINRIAFLIGFKDPHRRCFGQCAKAEFAVGNAFLRLFFNADVENRAEPERPAFDEYLLG